MPHETSRPSPLAEEILDKVEDRIRQALDEFHLTAFHIRPTCLWQRGFPEKAKDTIVISTYDTDNTAWKEVAQLVFDIVEERAGPAGLQFRVEIRNPQRMYCDQSEIVRSGTPALRTFLRIEPYVEAQVQKSCPTHWTSIAYHNRHPKNQEADVTATVIIFVKPGSIHFWSLVEEEVRTEIASVSLIDDITVNVEILPGFITPTIDEGTKPRFLDLTSLPESPRNGASISPRLDGRSAGTLGPVVFYQANGETRKTKCFLTCYHVIESGDPQGRMTNKSEGIGLDGKEITQHIIINYPAMYDARHTWKILTAELAAGRDPNSINSTTLQRLDRLAGADGGIGSVKYASGHRINENDRRPDWALVALNSPGPGDTMENKPAPKTAIDPDFLEGLHHRYNATSDDVITSIAKTFKRDVVVKIGRSSGTTIGEISEMRRKMQWGGGVMSHEIEAKSIASGKEFARPGDSGSMVYNLGLEWVGMVFAADTFAELGFLTPAHDIMDDIQAKTGGTISLV